MIAVLQFRCSVPVSPCISYINQSAYLAFEEDSGGAG